MRYLAVLFAAIVAVQGAPQFAKLVNSNTKLVITPQAQSLNIIFEDGDGKTVLSAHVGVSFPDTIAYVEDPECEGLACYSWGDFAQLKVTYSTEENRYTLEWYSAFGKRLEDCFELSETNHWYGGAETKVQTWPIESVAREEAAYVTGDFLQPVQFGGVLEHYWLTSSGAAIKVSEETPLFTSWNTTRQNRFCLAAQDRLPYVERQDLRLKYDVNVPKVGETFKDVHIRSLKRYYTLPTQLPDQDMLVYPLWSTWAQYREGINQELVVEMGNRIVAEGYTKNSHLEIDDHWETCYGEAVFNTNKFPDPQGMLNGLRELGINKSTLWIHPFINRDCPSYETAFEKGYFVKNSKSRQELTSWWQGADSGLIDFSNPEAVNWWRSRLEKLQSEFGITSFKFDAGEATWLPPTIHLTQGDPMLLPNILSTQYVEAVSYFGGMVETRTGHRNQKLPMFIRMLDKDSNWSNNNGIKSLIPTLLLCSVLGYSYILPDMIGGNAYGEKPSDDLYIRWAQANVFMPSWQFSVLPWDVDPTGERDRIVKAAVDLRLAHAEDILEAARQTTVDGTPMVRPLWWVDPEDSNTYTVDDQFMLGDNILVAPVVTEGATSRDIYLPKGQWLVDGVQEKLTIEGPVLLPSWPAPLDYLPFFVKQ